MDPSLTPAVLEAVDRHADDYRAIIGEPRRHGADALLERLGVLPPWGEGNFDDDSATFDLSTMMLDHLAVRVGGHRALEQLRTAPLPDEAFQHDDLSPDLFGRLDAIVALTDEFCDTFCGVEYRTAVRRLLHDVASGNPDIFRRTSKDATAAAAVCWIIGKANDSFTQQYGGIQVQDLMRHFGLTGSVGQRANTMVKALDIQPSDPTILGTARYLTGSTRARLSDLRDRYAQEG